MKEIVQADFLQQEPTQKYDLVLSIGFIEHFVNYDDVLDRHLAYLKPGGAMLIMVPNKRYFRKYYGLLTGQANLKVHILKCANIKVFRDFASRNGLVVRSLSYYGGFAYMVHQNLNLPQKVLYKVIRALSRKLNPLLETHPSPFYSGSIVSIFHKPNA